MESKDHSPPPSCGALLLQLLAVLLALAVVVGFIALLASRDHSDDSRSCTGGAYEVEC